MALFTRLLTTLRADAHGVVDVIEDRALMLRHHLREAEAAVQRKQARLAALDAEEKRARTERERASREAARVDQDVELALGQDEPDLARYAVKRLLPLRQLVVRVDERLRGIEDERQELTRTLAEQQAALGELRCRVHAALAAEARAQEGSLSLEPHAVTEEQVELELLRRRRAREDEGAGGGSHEAG